MPRVITWSLLVSLFLGSGCGSTGPEPVDIQGIATFGGTPIVYGTLEFIPDADRQMTGPAGSAEVVDGKFDSKQGGRGVFLGPYDVRVTAWSERPPAGSNDETVVSKAEPPLFVAYIVKVNVLADNNVIEVPAKAKGFGIPKGL